MKTARTDVLDPVLIERFRKDVLALAKATDRVKNRKEVGILHRATRKWADDFRHFGASVREDLEGRIREAKMYMEHGYKSERPMSDPDWAKWYINNMKPFWDLQYEVNNLAELPDLESRDGGYFEEPAVARARSIEFYRTKYPEMDAERETDAYYDRHPMKTREEAEQDALVKWHEKADPWAVRVRFKALKAWKYLTDLVRWAEKDYLSAGGGKDPISVVTPEEETVTLEGFKMVFRGYEESSYKDRLEALRQGLHAYRERAAKVLPILMQKQLPMIVEWTFNPMTGEEAGSYHGHYINITPWALTTDISKFVEIAAHEMGHHLFHTVLTKERQDFWNTAIRGDYGPLDLREALKVLDTHHVDTLDKELAEIDPILYLQLGTLRADPSFKGHDLWNRDAIRKYVETPGNNPVFPVPQSPITGYAGKNSQEAFCEAVGRLVAYGPKVLPEMVKEWLRVVIPSIRTSAQRVADQWEPSNYTYSGFHIVDHGVRPDAARTMLSGLDSLIATFRKRGMEAVLHEGITSVHLAEGGAEHGVYHSPSKALYVYDIAANPVQSGRLTEDWIFEVFLHEFGHAVHLRLLHSRAKAEWDAGWTEVDQLQEAFSAKTSVTPEDRKKFFGLLQTSAWNMTAQTPSQLPVSWVMSVVGKRLKGVEQLKYLMWLYNPGGLENSNQLSSSPVRVAPTKYGREVMIFFADPEGYVLQEYPVGYYDDAYRAKTLERRMRIYTGNLGLRSSQNGPSLDSEMVAKMRAEDPSVDVALEKLGLPSWYARTNVLEDFAETFVLFVLHPERLSEVARGRMARALALSGLYGKPIGRLAMETPRAPDHYFKPGDLVTYGKWQNKPGQIVRIFEDERGIPMIEIAAVGHPLRKNRVFSLYRIRHADPVLRVASQWLNRVALDFDTKEEMEQYRKDHEVREDTKLTVKKPDERDVPKHEDAHITKGMEGYREGYKEFDGGSKEWVAEHEITTPGGSYILGTPHHGESKKGDAWHKKTLIPSVLAAADKAIKAGKKVVFLAEGGVAGPGSWQREQKDDPGAEQGQVAEALEKSFGDKVTQDTWDGDRVRIDKEVRDEEKSTDTNEVTKLQVDPKAPVTKKLIQKFKDPVLVEAGLAGAMFDQMGEEVTENPYIVSPEAQKYLKAKGIDWNSRGSISKMWDDDDLSAVAAANAQLRDEEFVKKVRDTEASGAVAIVTPGAQHAYQLKNVLGPKPKGKSASRVASAFLASQTKRAGPGCSKTETSYAWIAPDGHLHLMRGYGHYGWALEYVRKNKLPLDLNRFFPEDEWEAGRTAANYLVAEGWVRVLNYATMHGLHPKRGSPAWETAAGIVAGCSPSLEDTEIQVHVPYQSPVQHKAADFVEMFGNRQMFAEMYARLSGRTASSFPVYTSYVYLPQSQFRGVSSACDEVQDLIEALKAGDAQATETIAHTMAAHPVLRGFKGVVVPAPRSTPGHTMAHLAEALVRHGVGDRVVRAVARIAPVESSRLRRHQGLPGVSEVDHVRSMGTDEGLPADASVLVVDDVFTTGSTLRAAAWTLQRAGHLGEIIGAAAAMVTSDMSGCPVKYQKAVG